MRNISSIKRGDHVRRGSALEVRGLLDEPGMAIPVADVEEAVGVCVSVGTTGLVELEVGLAEVLRCGVTKFV